MSRQDLIHGTESTPAGDLHSMVAKIRFAVLWTVVGSALAGTMAVFFYEPDVLEEGVAGEMEGEPVTMGMALMNAALVALPLVLAALSLFLSTHSGAISNLVVGVPLGVFGLFAVVSHAAAGTWHAHVTLAALAAVVAWLIVALSVAELRRHDASSRRP